MNMKYKEKYFSRIKQCYQKTKCNNNFLSNNNAIRRRNLERVR